MEKQNNNYSFQEWKKYFYNNKMNYMLENYTNRFKTLEILFKPIEEAIYDDTKDLKIFLMRINQNLDTILGNEFLYKPINYPELDSKGNKTGFKMGINGKFLLSGVSKFNKISVETGLVINPSNDEIITEITECISFIDQDCVIFEILDENLNALYSFNDLIGFYGTNNISSLKNLITQDFNQYYSFHKRQFKPDINEIVLQMLSNDEMESVSIHDVYRCFRLINQDLKENDIFYKPFNEINQLDEPNIRRDIELYFRDYTITNTVVVDNKIIPLSNFVRSTVNYDLNDIQECYLTNAVNAYVKFKLASKASKNNMKLNRRKRNN